MPRQLTIRNVPDEVGKRLDRLSRDRGESLNTVVLDILTETVGVDARSARLTRYATWTSDDAAAFDAALSSRLVLDTSAYSHFRRGHPGVLDALARTERVLIPATVLATIDCAGTLLTFDRDFERIRGMDRTTLAAHEG